MNEEKKTARPRKTDRKVFRERHPDLPFWLSIIALAASIAMPILRKVLEGMT